MNEYDIHFVSFFWPRLCGFNPVDFTQIGQALFLPIFFDTFLTQSSSFLGITDLWFVASISLIDPVYLSLDHVLASIRLGSDP